MKTLLKHIVNCISSLQKGKYAGKMIGLLDFCRQTICSNKRTFAGQIHERMDLNNILPPKALLNCASIEDTNKIKVRIVYPSGDSWNNIHTLYEAFVNDERFQTYILVERRERFINILNNANAKYVFFDQYDLKLDKPDILIPTYYSSADKFLSFPDCHKYVKRIIASIPNAVMNEENTDIHWSYVNNAYHYLNPDVYLVSPLVYNGLKGYVEDSKLVKMGNPQFDEIFREVGRCHPIPNSWEKLKGKKVFLWATDHGINESYAKNGFTIDLYLADMFKYFSSHPELGLIFRPHPQFMHEIIKGGHFWSQYDIQQIVDFINSTPNIIWDNTPDFCCAYDTCSALIVDANCSITCTFLTTGKPICRLLRYDIKEWLISPELHDCYYYAKGFHECEDFINMIVRGEDVKESLRTEAMAKSILNFDGKNGERMKDYIISDYFNHVK